MGLQIPSPKSQHGGKAPTFEPQEPIKVRFVPDLDSFMQKKFSGLVLRVESSFLLNPTFNASLEPHLYKGLPCRHQCHTWDLGLGTRVKWQVQTSMLSTAETAWIDLK